jgi:two-component system, NtrC family, sensor kinase
VPTLYVLRGPDKGRTFQTPDEPMLLGRQSEHLPLTDHAASREHARLEPVGDQWRIEDLSSSNGTYVNGERIHHPTTLKHGDQIKIGTTLLVFTGNDSVARFSGPALTRDLVEYASGNQDAMDSSILSAVPSCEDSVILAAPETADAVHAWKLMYRIAEAIGTFTRVDDLLERITDLLCEHFVFDRVLVLMRDAHGDEFLPQVVRCRPRRRKEPPRITASQTLINHVRRTKNGILCANALTDERFANGDKSASMHNLGLRSVLCVPIIAHDEVQGIIHLDCKMVQHTYTPEQLRLATAIGRMTGMAIENARLLQSRMQNERLVAMGETVAYLSHHIRNILQGLHGGSDVLELGIKRQDLDTVVSAWKIIQTNLDRTLHLATNMLTFSKEREPVIEITQLNKLVEDAVGLALRHAEEKGVALVTECAELPPIPVDKEGMHQVVLNVVLNAIDACPRTGGRVIVSTAYEPDRSTVIVSVSDNGCGIAAEDLPHLFEPFRSNKGSRGTGLGLAAARKIVRENKGEIHVDTHPNEGTRFTVAIPVGQTHILDSDKTIGPQ